MKTATLKRIAFVEIPYLIMHDKISIERGERLEMKIRRVLFQRNPHHRCDTCNKAMSEISGPRCGPCLIDTLRVPVTTV